MFVVPVVAGCRACSWAVGWVGRAEPALVAPRALALGADAVLAQLAGHPPALLHVRAALLDLFTVRTSSIIIIISLSTKATLSLIRFDYSLALDGS